MMPTKKLKQEIYDSIIQLERILHPIRNKILAELDVTISQAEVLHVLQNKKTIKELADALFISSSATTQLVELLENKKMVTRVHSKNDRRVVNVEITKEGQAVKERILQKCQQITETLLAELTDKEITQLTAMHAKMAASMQKKYE